MMRRLIALLLLGLIGLSSTSRADHLDEKQLAKGTPERTLAGIHLSEHTRIADVIRLYGQPTKREGSESDNPNFASSYDYYWIRPRLKLHVLVQRFPRTMPGWEYISLVEVDFGSSHGVAKTGKGLRLGNSLKDLKRIYGHRVQVRDIPEQNIRYAMIQWRQEEYSLVANLDKRDKITALQLVAPE